MSLDLIGLIQHLREEIPAATFQNAAASLAIKKVINCNNFDVNQISFLRLSPFCICWSTDGAFNMRHLQKLAVRISVLGCHVGKTTVISATLSF